MVIELHRRYGVGASYIGRILREAELTSEYSAEVLRKAIAKHGRPEEMLSDHGPTFYAVEADWKEEGEIIYNPNSSIFR